MPDWWQGLAIRRDKRSGKVLIRRSHSHRWIDAALLYGPSERLVLDLVAGARDMEAKERRRVRERGYATIQPIDEEP